MSALIQRRVDSSLLVMTAHLFFIIEKHLEKVVLVVVVVICGEGGRPLIPILLDLVLEDLALEAIDAEVRIVYYLVAVRLLLSAASGIDIEEYVSLFRIVSVLLRVAVVVEGTGLLSSREIEFVGVGGAHIERGVVVADVELECHKLLGLD